MTKDVLIIPGFGENETEESYKKLKERILAVGDSTVRFYNPKWNRGTTKNWLADFEKTSGIKPETIVIGFSMGAYITLLLAEHHNASKIVFASLSPYFKENISLVPDSAKKFFGKKRIEDFLRYSVPENIKTQNPVFLFGELDWDIAIDQAKRLAKKYNGLFEFIGNTPHELTEEYINKIVDQV
ncbi:MAG TPA: alpha/beta hydrolase [Candidatus Paceibacterota bacterium]|nr:alpha/beta hydrolase [Candidatus Paceibacterota bacterium]